jgi:ribosome biogenesis GTPase A
VVLQSHAADALGYFQPRGGAGAAPLAGSGLETVGGAAAVETAAGTTQHVICQRCHRAKHYGHLVPVTVPYKDFHDNLTRVLARPDVVVVVVLDVTDVHGTFLKELAAADLARRADDVVFAVNKCDLLPPSVVNEHHERLQRWVRTELKRLGFRPPASVHLVSSLTGAGVKSVMARIKVR